jgi:hypothetical protein
MKMETMMSHITTDDLRSWIPSQLPTALAEVLDQLPSRRRRRRLVRRVLLAAGLAVIGGVVAVIVAIPTLPSGQPDADDEA